MQIVDQARQYAVSGRLQAGDPLPSVRTIARELDVNHMTVSKAYSILRREGVVKQIRGKGMVMSSKTPVNPLEAIKPEAANLVATVLRLGLSRKDMDTAIDRAWAEAERQESNESAVDAPL